MSVRRQVFAFVGSAGTVGLWLVVLLFAGSAGVARAAEYDANAWPSHPRLLLDGQDVRSLGQRVADSPWAERWAAYRADVDQRLARPLELPPRGGNWSHNYVCPDHGARLQLGRQIGAWEWEHRCPAGRHVLLGDASQARLDFNGNAIMGVHLDYAKLLVDAGVAYQITRDRQYAEQSRDILLAYAAKYLSYDRHDNRGRPKGGGRVASQSLTEASWLIHMAQGADLIWETLDDQQRRDAEERLFRPALDEIILPAKLGIHNIQCRHNAAIGLVGFLLGDENLVGIAIDDSARGFRQQILQGVRDDGMWFEGASGYHFFTIEGLWPLAEAARHCGIDLYDARFKSMFDGPLTLAMPDLKLPNFNDSGTVALTSRADLYELAHARWSDARYLPLVAAGRRSGNLALWFGAVELPAERAATDRGSRNSPASGYAILERGAGDQATWLCVKYGPHGGGHGHNDKNHFVLYSRGAVLMPDAGAHAYGSPLHASWDKTSLAHNTLVVDQRSQAQAEGRCLAFGAAGGADFAITDAGDIYPGVRFVRSVALLNENLAVIVDQVQADRERVFDVACHFQGTWKELPDGQPWTPPDAPGYQHIADATTRVHAAGVTLRTSLDDNQEITITLADDEPTEIITGTGVGASTAERVPLMIVRRQAQETAFVWAVALDGRPATLQTLEVRDADRQPISAATATALTVRSGPRCSSLLINPDKQSVQVRLPQGDWSCSEPFAVRTCSDNSD